MAPPIREVTDQHRAALKSALIAATDRADIRGIDIGYKYEELATDGSIALRFHLERKELRASRVKRKDLIPPEWGGVPTDVLQIPMRFSGARAFPVARTGKWELLQPGISVSHVHAGAGTLGAIVYDATTGLAGILSCAHVLAPETAKDGDPIHQPSLSDLGDPRTDAVAVLRRSNEELDAAFAELTLSRQVRPNQVESDAVIFSAQEVDRIGEVLMKSGRTTGVTRGRVDGIGAYRLRLRSAAVNWIPGFMLAAPEGLTSDEEVSGSGDSGAIWYRKEGAAAAVGMGLHLAGERTEEEIEYAIAVHLPAVLRELRVSLQPIVASAGLRRFQRILGACPPPISERDSVLNTKSRRPQGVRTASGEKAGRAAPRRGKRAGEERVTA